jgi:aryl carrier-like protein
VLEGASACLAPGGAIYLGDVRDLRLMEAFHATVQAARAEPDAPRRLLAARVRRAIENEGELLVDPALFHALPQRMPEIAAVEVRPKRGRARNELTRFRYQVVLRVAGGTAGRTQGVPVPLSPDPTAVRDALQAAAAPAYAVRGLRDARVAAPLALQDWLRSGSETALATEGSEIEDLAALAASAPGWRFVSHWPPGCPPGRFDALFLRDGARIEPPPPPPSQDPSALCNDPLLGRLRRDLLPELRAHVRARLPEPMRPAEIMLLSEWPLGPTGKVDRAALPLPAAPGSELSGRADRPRPGTEEKLATLWESLLGPSTAPVARQDDFFALGGHSLLLTQLVSRLRAGFGVDVSIAALYARPALAEMADYLDTLVWAAEATAAGEPADAAVEL